jgi:hypothetical protein
MAVVKTFQSPDLPLREILDDIASGKVQLPDFQRDWVWDDDHVRSLLASVSLSYPIGAVMLLETGRDGTVFKPRLVESVELQEPHPHPDLLILDGQQRLTSLYTALRGGKPVKTKNAKKQVVERWYYIDMRRALDPAEDRDEVVISIGPDRIRRSIQHGVEIDLSTSEKEYEERMFPLALVLASSDWRRGYNRFWSHAEDKSELFDRFEEEVIKRFEQYEIPGIELVKETPKEAVCQVFEKVNTGGVVLNVFELLTATYAAENFNLRDDWVERRTALLRHSLLREVASTDLLQTITLLKTHALPGVAVSCKRKDILNLSKDEYCTWADAALAGYVAAARLLAAEKIFDARDVPYRTQLVPLAAILAALGDNWKSDSVKQKVIRWYWCGVFGEMYGGATESRFANDLPQVLGWLEGGTEPDTVRDANFSPDRLLTLRTRLSAAYKGLHGTLMRDGARDFVSGEPFEIQTYFNDKVDIHHIFPKAWCVKNGIGRDRYDSIVNKTPLSAETNRAIGGRAPSEYLETVKRKSGADDVRVDEILRTHVINPELMRENDFEQFFDARRRELLNRIAAAMGKPLLVEEPEGAPAPEEDELAEIDDVLEVTEAMV